MDQRDGKCIFGENIYLRPIDYTDTENIVRWRNQDFVRNNFIIRELFTETIHLNWLKNKVYTGEVLQFIICLQNNDLPIGSVYFQNFDRKVKKAEYGIFVGERNEMGKGYGTEATIIATNYVFKMMGLNKIYLRVLAENKCAIKSYENAGFIREGTFKDELVFENGYQDLVFMAKFNTSIL